jgi:hypothetical protein
VPFQALIALHIAAAAGYALARQLLAEETEDQAKALPEAARAPVLASRGWLLRARARASEALRAASAETSEAHRALTAEYLAATGRDRHA